MFKIGDKVKCVDPGDFDCLKHGIFIIHDVGLFYIKVKDKYGNVYGGFFPTRFTLSFVLSNNIKVL